MRRRVSATIPETDNGIACMSPHADDPSSSVDHPAQKIAVADDLSGAPRRQFFTKVVAFLTGGVILAIPAAAGLGFFLDPLLRKKRDGSSGGKAMRDDRGFLRVASLASLPDDGRPKMFTVYDDVVDAWNRFADQPVGRVFLRKLPDGHVTAFNVRCPHAGCAVDYRAQQNDYFCPCHTSAFNLDGGPENQIPPRGLDELEVAIKDGTEVWVQYKVFKAGIPEKKSVSG
jgi:menaquinol-cytochrome c reductase iron-sulfur subunit